MGEPAEGEDGIVSMRRLAPFPCVAKGRWEDMSGIIVAFEALPRKEHEFGTLDETPRTQTRLFSFVFSSLIIHSAGG